MSSKPNVLLITADQLRADCLGLNGNPLIHTPNLDALGRRGMNFPRAFSSTPVCVPARYTLMTGRYPFSWGMRGASGVIPPDVPTLPAVLKEHGYRTALIGKAHFHGPEEECRELGIPIWRYRYGFDEMLLSEEGRQWAEGGDDYEAYLKEVGWHGYERAHGIGNNDARTSPSPLPEEHYQTAWCARESAAWIRRHAADRPGQPFFLWCSFVKPHAPYDPPEPWDRMYSPQEVPPPVGGPEDLEGLSPYYRRLLYEHQLDTLSEQAILRARAYYYGQVSQIDYEVGNLLRTLDELGLLRNTVILFCSDHGDMLGDHGLFFKHHFFEGSWHVPLLVAGPGVPQGVSERLVTLADVYPTLLQLAGVPLPEGTQGESLLAGSEREMVFGSLVAPPNRIFAARSDRFQYVVHENGGYHELYDMEADPGQTVNLAHHPDYQEVRRHFDERMAAWFHEIDPGVLGDDGRIRVRPSSWEEPKPLKGKLGLRPH